jgi:hypothetical protein
MKVVIRVIALPPVLLKGNFEGGNWAIAFSRFFSREILKVVIGRSRMASASQTRFPESSQGKL